MFPDGYVDSEEEFRASFEAAVEHNRRYGEDLTKGVEEFKRAISRNQARKGGYYVVAGTFNYLTREAMAEIGQFLARQYRGASVLHLYYNDENGDMSCHEYYEEEHSDA
jgi:hypothetical protein